MVVEGAVGSAISSTSELVLELGKIGKWVQAVGLFVIVWIFIQFSNFLLNRKRMDLLKRMDYKLETLEKKLDKLSKRN